MTCCFDMQAGKTLTAGNSGGLEHMAAPLRTAAVPPTCLPSCFGHCSAATTPRPAAACVEKFLFEA